MSFPRYERYKDSGVEWLGEVPEGWEVKPFYSVASERDEPNRGMIENNLLSLSYGRIVQKDINTNDGLLPESFETYQVVRQGDIVFRLTDLQNDKRSLRTAIVEETGIITSAYVAAAPIGILPLYLNFLLRAYDETKVFYSMGGGLRQSMKFSDVKRLPTLVPPASEQQAIVAFLDRETVKIDALVAEQERLIALLKEKRQAVISHAVTKGLNPAAPLKDSGVEWLGEVPVGWEVNPLRRSLAKPLSNGIFKKKEEFGQGTLLVNVFDIYRDDFRVDFSTLDRVNCSQEEQNNYRVDVGDLFFVRSSLKEEGIAVVAVADNPEEAVVFECHLIQARFNTSRFLGKFGKYLLNSGQYRNQLIKSAKVTTMTTIDQEAILSLTIIVPPLDTQSAVVAFLDNETTKIDTLVSEAQQVVSLLKERRSALISEAVTGKIDVRSV